jgi:hypothetical protein
MVAVKTRGAVGALGVWWIATRLGVVSVDGWDGLFGLPRTVGGSVGLVLAGLWAFYFVRLVSVAVGRGLAEARRWDEGQRTVESF